MSRRVVPLSGAAVDQLPAPCRGCLFWELGRPRPEKRPSEGAVLDELAGDPLVQKQAWCAAQTMGAGPPGRIVRVDDEVAGYALFAPASALAPRRPPVPRTSDDALVLATLWIEPHHREHGIGRVLVQAALKEALRLQLDAVEAYGDRRFRDQDCVLPATWLLHEGFTVHREHPRYPLLRLDVRRTARWADTLEHALEEVWEWVPRPAPGRVPGTPPA